jgi:signal peptidase II
MNRRLLYAMVSTLVVVSDQLTKWLVRRSLDLHEYREVLAGFLSLSHVRNQGAAFGILSDAELPYQAALFVSLSLTALGALVLYARNLPVAATVPQVALALIMGGAVGNLIDRVAFGYVTDFIHVYWKQYSWPDFNVADSAISTGVCLLLLDMFRAPAADQALATRPSEDDPLAPLSRRAPE